MPTTYARTALRGSLQLVHEKLYSSIILKCRNFSNSNKFEQMQTQKLSIECDGFKQHCYQYSFNVLVLYRSCAKFPWANI